MPLGKILIYLLLQEFSQLDVGRRPLEAFYPSDNLPIFVRMAGIGLEGRSVLLYIAILFVIAKRFVCKGVVQRTAEGNNMLNVEFGRTADEVAHADRLARVRTFPIRFLGQKDFENVARPWLLDAYVFENFFLGIFAGLFVLPVLL